MSRCINQKVREVHDLSLALTDQELEELGVYVNRLHPDHQVGGEDPADPGNDQASCGFAFDAAI